MRSTFQSRQGGHVRPFPIEVYGGTLDNFGDEMMLHSILEELARRLPASVPAMYPRDTSYSRRARAGLLHVLPGYGRGPAIARMGTSLLDRLAPQRAERLGQLYGVVSPREIRGVVTLSGFAFSDEWNGAATRAAAVFERYPRRQCRVVLLPQALGPFEQRETREQFLRIVDRAQVVYARDTRSLEYAKDATGNDERIHRGFDITLSRKESFVSGRPNGDGVCIVPNQRMLDHGSPSWRSRYVDALVTTARAIVRSGAEARVMAHGREESDELLADAVAAAVPGAIRVRVSNALQARRELARARVVVASRYHAIAGALANCVPVVGIGWTHKYDGLFEDFGLPDLSIREDQPIESILDRVFDLMSDGGNNHARLRIQGALPRVVRATEAMWDEAASQLGA